MLSLSHTHKNVSPFCQLQIIITSNCCAHCLIHCPQKCINFTGGQNCDRGKIKNRSTASDGINGKALKSRWSKCCRIPERAVTNGRVSNRLRSLLKIDTGKWCWARRGAVSIKVQRGVPPICGKLINTKVIFIRTPTSGNSYIIRRDGEWKVKLVMHLQTSGCHPDCVFMDVGWGRRTSSHQDDRMKLPLSAA